MWTELKIGVTLMGGLLIGVGFLFGGLPSLIIAIMGVGTIMFGDMLIAWKIKNSDASKLIEPNNPGEVVMILHLIGGNIRFVKGKQKSNGKIEFVYQRKECSIYNKGKYTKRLPNGNTCVLAHESYDQTVDPAEVKFLEEASSECDDAKDVKHIYRFLDNKIKEETGGKVNA